MLCKTVAMQPKSLSGRQFNLTTLISDFLATLEEEPGITPSTIIRHTPSMWEGRTAGKLAWINKALHNILTFGTPWIYAEGRAKIKVVVVASHL